MTKYLAEKDYKPPYEVVGACELAEMAYIAYLVKSGMSELNQTSFSYRGLKLQGITKYNCGMPTTLCTSNLMAGWLFYLKNDATVIPLRPIMIQPEFGTSLRVVKTELIDQPKFTTLQIAKILLNYQPYIDNLIRLCGGFNIKFEEERLIANSTAYSRWLAEHD